MEFFASVWRAAIDDNLVFTHVVGMLTVFIIALRPQDALKFAAWLGSAVSACAWLNWWVCKAFLVPWGIAYLAPVVYVLLSSTMIFAVGALRCRGRGVAGCRRMLSVCGLISLNACVLGAPLFMVSSLATDASPLAVAGTAVGSGLGVCIAIGIFTGLYQRVDECAVPASMRGLPMALLIASLLALAFSCVTGMSAVFGV